MSDASHSLLKFLNAGGEGETASSQPGTPAAPADAELLDAYSRAVIGVVAKVGPAVVAVSSRDERAAGSGSGFLLTPDGYMLTNSHVVHGGRQVSARTEDGDKIAADLIGEDPATDLALLRLAARDLPYAELGDSHSLQVGQLVIAMGNPLGFQSTVSTGVVSAVGRAFRGHQGRLIENVVQHTAPLNPGNSGGPLVDSRGRVVGINTAIIAMAQGLGFAVPSATARWVVGELITHGRVRRLALGITATTAPLPRRLARELDLLTDVAVEVAALVPGGAAQRAGLQEGDLIVAVGGRILTGLDDLHRLLAGFQEASVLDLTIVRGDRLLELAVEPEWAS
jgi:S1-C subfamily serine protease